MAGGRDVSIFADLLLKFIFILWDVLICLVLFFFFINKFLAVLSLSRLRERVIKRVMRNMSLDWRRVDLTAYCGNL